MMMLHSVHFEGRFKIANTNKGQLAADIGSAAIGSAFIASAGPIQAGPFASMLAGFLLIDNLMARIGEGIFGRCAKIFSKDKAAPQEPKAAAAPETKDTPAKPTP